MLDDHHAFYDNVRGVNKNLFPNNTSAEVTTNKWFNFF
jgi:hypothetical protein